MRGILKKHDIDLGDLLFAAYLAAIVIGMLYRSL